MSIIILGKSAAFFNSYGGNVISAVRDIGEDPKLADLIGGVKTMLDAYEEGTIDRLFLVSNEFVNTMTQDAAVEQLLPLEPEESDEMKHHWDYIYEPDAKELLEGLLTRYIESQVYQAVVENGACEQAADRKRQRGARRARQSRQSGPSRPPRPEGRLACGRRRRLSRDHGRLTDPPAPALPRPPRGSVDAAAYGAFDAP